MTRRPGFSPLDDRTDPPEPPDGPACPFSDCGSFAITHRCDTEGHHGAKGMWYNLCGDCGRLSEFIPTRRAVARECESIRSEWSERRLHENEGRVSPMFDQRFRAAIPPE